MIAQDYTLCWVEKKGRKWGNLILQQTPEFSFHIWLTVFFSSPQGEDLPCRMDQNFPFIYSPFLWRSVKTGTYCLFVLSLKSSKIWFLNVNVLFVLSEVTCNKKLSETFIIQTESSLTWTFYKLLYILLSIFLKFLKEYAYIFCVLLDSIMI